MTGGGGGVRIDIVVLREFSDDQCPSEIFGIWIWVGFARASTRGSVLSGLPRWAAVAPRWTTYRW